MFGLSGYRYTHCQPLVLTHCRYIIVYRPRLHYSRATKSVLFLKNTENDTVHNPKQTRLLTSFMSSTRVCVRACMYISSFTSHAHNEIHLLLCCKCDFLSPLRPRNIRLYIVHILTFCSNRAPLRTTCEALPACEQHVSRSRSTLGFYFFFHFVGKNRFCNL